MRRHQRIGLEEAKTIAAEEKKRQEKLDNQGLCFDCEENPQNSAIAGKVCLDCFESRDGVGCMYKGCPNSSDGSYRQFTLCEIHLISAIHSHYHEYLERRSEIEEQKRKLEDKIADLEYDPRDESIPRTELSDKAKELDNKWVSMILEKHNIAILKKEIKKSMEQVEEGFPEGYEVFG